MIWHKSFSVIESAGIKAWLGSRVNNWTSKVSIFYFFSMTRLFVRENKTCMIRIMTQQVLLNWGNIF